MEYDVHQHVIHPSWRMLLGWRDGELRLTYFNPPVPERERARAVRLLREFGERGSEDCGAISWPALAFNVATQEIRAQEWEPFSIES